MGRLQDFLASVGRASAGSVRALADQRSRFVDIERLRESASWRERASAVSWPRTTILAGVLGVTVAGVMLWVENTSPTPHPPALPSPHEVQVGQNAIENFMDGRPNFADPPPQKAASVQEPEAQ